MTERRKKMKRKRKPKTKPRLTAWVKRVSTISSKGHLIQFLFQTATQILKHQFVRVLQNHTTQCGFWTYSVWWVSIYYFMTSRALCTLSLQNYSENSYMGAVIVAFVSKSRPVRNKYNLLVYTTQVNNTFRARWLASSEVISQVLFTSTSVNNC